MVKKILGVLFILFSIFIGSSILINLPETIRLFFKLFSDSSGYEIGYFTGNFFVTILLSLFTFYLFKIGIKWVKKKDTATNTVDEIGKN